jgi:hypothetical protein
MYKNNENAKLKTWVQRPSGLNKMEGSTSAFNLENVKKLVLKQILIINLKLSFLYRKMTN